MSIILARIKKYLFKLNLIPSHWSYLFILIHCSVQLFDLCYWRIHLPFSYSIFSNHGVLFCSYYEGTISSFDASTKKHKVRFLLWQSAIFAASLFSLFFLRYNIFYLTAVFGGGLHFKFSDWFFSIYLIMSVIILRLFSPSTNVVLYDLWIGWVWWWRWGGFKSENWTMGILRRWNFNWYCRCSFPLPFDISFFFLKSLFLSPDNYYIIFISQDLFVDMKSPHSRPIM